MVIIYCTNFENVLFPFHNISRIEEILFRFMHRDLGELRHQNALLRDAKWTNQLLLYLDKATLIFTLLGRSKPAMQGDLNGVDDCPCMTKVKRSKGCKCATMHNRRRDSFKASKAISRTCKAVCLNLYLEIGDPQVHKRKIH